MKKIMKDDGGRFPTGNNEGYTGNGGRKKVSKEGC